jgi:hypothetical protein
MILYERLVNGSTRDPNSAITTSVEYIVMPSIGLGSWYK